MLNNMIYIGHVAKTHGLNGSFSIKLDIPHDLCALFDKIKKIYLPQQVAPLLIIKSQLNNKIFLRVIIDSITNRESAKHILRQSIYIKKGDQPNIDKKFNQKYEFLNFQIFDKKEGNIGVVQEIDFNRPQTLFIVKQEKTTILVPFVEELIVSVNRKTKIINVDLPENLIEICNQ